MGKKRKKKFGKAKVREIDGKKKMKTRGRLNPLYAFMFVNVCKYMYVEVCKYLCSSVCKLMYVCVSAWLALKVKRMLLFFFEAYSLGGSRRGDGLDL